MKFTEMLRTYFTTVFYDKWFNNKEQLQYLKMYNVMIPNLSGVTILLSLTVFSQVVTDTMPRTSDAMPLLGNNYPKIVSTKNIFTMPNVDVQ